MDIDNYDFMFAEARVEHGGEPSIRMHGDVHRKIADVHLAADGAQRPLVRQQHRPIRTQTRQFHVGGRRRRGHLGGAGGEADGQPACEAKKKFSQMSRDAQAIIGNKFSHRLTLATRLIAGRLEC
jgi:hypothetical protein